MAMETSISMIGSFCASLLCRWRSIFLQPKVRTSMSSVPQPYTSPALFIAAQVALQPAGVRVAAEHTFRAAEQQARAAAAAAKQEQGATRRGRGVPTGDAAAGTARADRGPTTWLRQVFTTDLGLADCLDHRDAHQLEQLDAVLCAWPGRNEATPVRGHGLLARADG